LEKESLDTSQKIEILKETCLDKAELDQVLGKLFDVTLSQHRRRLERYEHDLAEFENRFGMDSATFYERFDTGELGDSMDFFEWAGLYKLQVDLIEKIKRLESVL
jgi:hypothetical protein